MSEPSRCPQCWHAKYLVFDDPERIVCKACGTTSAPAELRPQRQEENAR